MIVHTWRCSIRLTTLARRNRRANEWVSQLEDGHACRSGEPAGKSVPFTTVLQAADLKPIHNFDPETTRKPMANHVVALTIAGSDPSGGAGLQADLKTFHQHGVYGTSVVSLLTVQNTRGVRDVKILDPTFVQAQLDAVLGDIPPIAVKTGALGSAENITVVANCAALLQVPFVVDPVMISKHGARLMAEDAIATLTKRLLPLATLVTPNLPEASALCGLPVTRQADMEVAALAIADLGVPNVLIKGGHLVGDASDLLLADGEFHVLQSERIETPHTHGTGCVYSAAIAARLARGEPLVQAVQSAKRFVTAAIRSNPALGAGQGPTNMFADPS